MIIIVFGLPGSGKSFFAEKLAASLNAIYYSTDKTRKNLSRNPGYHPDEKQQVYEYLLEVIDFTSTIVIDGTFYKNGIRKRFYNKATALKQKIVFIEIVADEKLIELRTNKPRKDSDADYSIYKKIKQEFEPMNEPHLLLESKVNNIQEMLRIAIIHLNAIT